MTFAASPDEAAVPDARFEQLRKLTEISRALTYTTALDEILPLATARAADLLKASTALLMLADENGRLNVRATHGVDADVLSRFSERLDENLIQRLQTVLTVSSDDCFLGVPLVAHGSVTGLLAVVRPGPHAVTDEEEWLLSAVADQVAVALENGRLAEEVRRHVSETGSGAAGSPDPEGSGERALATLSHDLRSPLNAIDSYAELIEMEIMGPLTDRQREALGRIRMSGRHLLAVLENVLEMARINADVIRVQTRDFDAATVIGDAVLMVRPSASAKGQALSLAIDSSPTIRADADRLRQVLVNLLSNAVKYAHPGGSIHIAAKEGGGGGARFGMISVTDDGPGIPADKLQSVFLPYYRIPGDETGAPEGTGLGLAISRELITRMGGEIAVESEAGHGCTFTIRLPLAAAGAGIERGRDLDSIPGS